MDPVTHGLASFALARGLFPRARKLAVVGVIFAGVIADVDWFGVFAGPAAFLSGHRTAFHSLVAAFIVPVLLVTAIPVLLGVIANRFFGMVLSVRSPREGDATFAYVFGAYLGAALLHIAMDACQSTGVMLFWPFSTKRFAADWLPALDPWLLVILIFTIAIPELLALVSSEIGAKSKKPRGQTGALIGLALLVVYIAARGTLHTNAVALLESRSFHGEAARRAVAYPEALSLTTWHGIAETESALNRLDIHSASPATFDADASQQIFKPEPSPTLDAARNTPVAKRFLSVAQVPKASVEKTDVGYVVILRDLRYAASGETHHEIAALIELDPSGQVTSQELVWARDLRR